VRNILRSHGCVIHVSSESGSGTTFSFTLPLAADGVVARDAERPSNAEAPAEPPQQPAQTPTAPSVEPTHPDEEFRPRLRIIRRG